MIRRLLLAVLALVLPAGIASAQDPLSLADAIAKARAGNPDARAAEVATRRAEARVQQARAAYLPSADLTESWQRGTHPVFVFSSRLAQRQFGAANFAIDALNHPEAVNNLRVGLSVDHAVFDPSTRVQVKTATLGRDLATASQAAVAQDLAVAVTGAYGAVLTAEAATRAADASVASAEADLTLAQNRRDAGVVTDADVLQVEVFLGRAREQRIRSAADAEVARARLNALMGVPLDAHFTFDDTPPPSAVAPRDPADLERTALDARPDLKIAGLQTSLATAAVDAARATFLPRIHAHGVWEGNGDGWGARASSWTVGAVARVNLFRGLADKARLTEARHAETARRIEQEKAETAARLDVRIASARLVAARAAEAVARTSVAQAREGQRIVRDRYEGGLADVSALLRAADGVQQADARHAAARVEITVAAATLARALGEP